MVSVWIRFNDAFDGETVLERLTGKRQILSESRPAPASREDTGAAIENAPWRDGSRAVRVRRGEIVGCTAWQVWR